MSEREVLGFSVAVDRLWALVGSGQDLDLLAAWVKRVPDGESLILIIDGDQ